MCVPCLAIVFLEAFINVLSFALMSAIFVRVLLSWVPFRLPWGLGEFAWAVSEPILAPIRRVLRPSAGIDFSPFLALLLIQLVTALVLRLLPPVP